VSPLTFAVAKSIAGCLHGSCSSTLHKIINCVNSGVQEHGVQDIAEIEMPFFEDLAAKNKINLECLDIAQIFLTSRKLSPL